MTNSNVFIVMVTHQCDFTPRMHFAGQNHCKNYTASRNYQLLCSLQTSNVHVFPIFYFCRLTAGFEDLMLFLYAKNVVYLPK